MHTAWWTTSLSCRSAAVARLAAPLGCKSDPLYSRRILSATGVGSAWGLDSPVLETLKTGELASAKHRRRGGQWDNWGRSAKSKMCQCQAVYKCLLIVCGEVRASLSNWNYWGKCHGCVIVIVKQFLQVIFYANVKHVPLCKHHIVSIKSWSSMVHTQWFTVASTTSTRDSTAPRNLWKATFRQTTKKSLESFWKQTYIDMVHWTGW